MARFVTLALLLLGGCAYVSKGEFDAVYDKDGDGWPFDQDCDDSDKFIYPGAPDFRGDGCDADCGVAADQDGDDWPDDADCDPTDPTIYPCAPDADDDGVDSDCDGRDTRRGDLGTCTGLDPSYGADVEQHQFHADECGNPAGPSGGDTNGG